MNERISLISLISLISFFHLIIKRINFYNPNIITCICAQIYFLYNSLSSFLKNDKSLFIYNMDFLASYFIYDIIYIILNNKDHLFIIHHIIGLWCIKTVKDRNIDMYYSNILCIILEIVNPFLNMRYLLNKSSYFYRLNLKVIFILYSIFRIILFPYFSIKFIKNNNLPNIRTIFFLVYMMSLYWYRKIIRL